MRHSREPGQPHLNLATRTSADAESSILTTVKLMPPLARAWSKFCPSSPPDVQVEIAVTSPQESESRDELLLLRDQLEAGASDDLTLTRVANQLLNSNCSHSNEILVSDPLCCLLERVMTATVYLDRVSELPPDEIDYTLSGKVGANLAGDLQRLRVRPDADNVLLDGYSLIGLVATALIADHPEIGVIADGKRAAITQSAALQLLQRLQDLDTVTDKTIWAVRLCADAMAISGIDGDGSMSGFAGRLDSRQTLNYRAS